MRSKKVASARVEKNKRNLNKENRELKRIEEELRDSKKRYQQLLDFLPYAIFTHCENKIVFANNATLELLHLSNFSDILGKPVLEFVYPECHQESIERINQAYIGFETPTCERKMLTADGKVIDVETKSIPFHI